MAGLAAVVLSVGLATGPDAAAQTAAEQEVCNLIKVYCRKVDGVRVNEPICQAARKQKRTYGYACGKRRKQQSAGPKVCRGHVESGRGAVVSYSYDTKNPSIFAYCTRRSGPEARECAYRACLERGGTHCRPPCDPASGSEIRACRAETVTLVRSRDYIRLGCGARYVRAGKHTFDSYVQREMERCVKQSKSPGSCRLEAAWQ